MANYQSAGVYVKEYDFSTYVNGVATTEAAIGGVFSWGPVESPDLISTEGELEARFGKPTEDNYETFLIAANFLSYSGALYVSRAADANVLNAVATANGSPVALQIKNDTDYIVKKPSFSADAVFYARCPSALGNGLRISQCDSANAYSKTFAANTLVTVQFNISRDSNIGTLTVTSISAGNNATANTAINAIIPELDIGSFLSVSNTVVGSQNLKIAAVGSPSVANGVATLSLNFSNRFQLAADLSTTSVTRLWEYYDSVSKAPGTSPYVEARGGNGDELHIVVVDRLGKFSGTPGTVLEVWDSLSRASDVVYEGTSRYYKDVLYNSSLYVYPANDRPGAPTALASTVTAVNTKALVANFTGGTDSATEAGISLAAMARAYDKFKNPEEIDIGLIIAGRALGGTNGEGLANYIIDNIVENRKDVFLTISPSISDVVNNPYQELADTLVFRTSLRKTSYAMLSTSYKYQYDRYADKYRWVAGCGDDAGLLARTEQERDAWWSPAGHSRGIYKNLVKLSYNPDKSDRDVLYRNDINPVVTMKGSGTLLYGDKTLLGSPSAFDRINVRRLFIVLEKAISKAAKELLFEFNDVFTRARFRTMVEPFLRDVQGRRGIVAYKVVCDETNNTPIVIDQNRFIGSILIRPNKTISFVELNFAAVGHSVSFDYVVSALSGAV